MKIGDIICPNMQCKNCPLRCLNCWITYPINTTKNIIREVWSRTLKAYPQLEPMREYIENELNKEVEQ